MNSTKYNYYKYTNKLRVTTNDKLIILGSEDSGNWIKISSESFNILNKVLDMNLNHKEILECFESEEDKKYFDDLIKKLYGANILIDKDKETRRKIKGAYILLTERCNLSCTHCCADALGINSKDDLSTDLMIEVIDKVISLNPEIITISGGEPLVRDDIWELMDHLKNRFTGIIEIMTNGLLINENNIYNFKKYFDKASISIDGIDEESCKIIRGNNVFNKVLKTIKLLKDNNFEDISLSAVLPNNDKLIEEFNKLNKDLGTEAMVRYFSYKGRAGKNFEKITVEMNKYLKSRNMEERKIIEWDKYFSIDKNHTTIKGCGGCESVITIGSDGHMYPCNLLIDMKYRIGNILDIKDINSYMNNMNKNSNSGYKTFIDLKSCNNNKCESCSVKDFCWNCPAECDDLLSKNDVFEERCSQVKEILNSVVWG
jgi:radical SAM protein with 4Fe4S-binding SPASM domain